MDILLRKKIIELSINFLPLLERQDFPLSAVSSIYRAEIIGDWKAANGLSDDVITCT